MKITSVLNQVDIKTKFYRTKNKNKTKYKKNPPAHNASYSQNLKQTILQMCSFQI